MEVMRGLGRALGGAVLFAMPLFLTMEVWRIGLHVERWRLALLLAATVLLVLGLVRELGGASDESGWRSDLADTGIALLMAAVAAAAVLTVLGRMDWLEDWRGATSILAIETLPAAAGASYARSQLGQDSAAATQSGYGHELFLMVAGAAVFAANVAPTEEIVLLAAAATPWHLLATVLLSLVLMHGFVYGAGFKGEEESRGFLRSFATFTVAGYVLAFAVAAFLLWILGRFDGTGLGMVLAESVVLALPASVGAAAARLIL
ncbi:TIGR02587 family membrane protein [Geodermatophilus sp. DF01-2]|uniref:TIGR02587 family membrane protein n=1 Tax=Geodermatophilus sp. DF01-2 TaxID=2559610 RepID=UPI001074497F|nr:TIGR02587 family membrane protein [Geodermatophilus sp. DF01_2]TFV57732.1 TIGR02587 family membrane protein [Geodermatophilus sp. DF01_2]